MTYIGRGGGFFSGAGTITERRGRTKDQVQQNRRNRSDGSGETSLTDSGGGGGGGVMSTGGEEVRKLSTRTPLSAEAVEFSLAEAREQHRQVGRRNMAVGTSGNKPTQVEELPLSKAGGGG